MEVGVFATALMMGMIGDGDDSFDGNGVTIMVIALMTVVVMMRSSP